MAKTDNTKSRYYNPFVTTGGTYANPRLGIVDYTQIQTGFDEGIKPGLELVEQREKDYLARIKTAEGVEDITTAAGDFFDGNNFNPDISMINEYKDVVNSYRDVLLKRNSSAEDIRNAKEAVGHLRVSNESLAHLLNVDSDSEMYSERASGGINDLFVKQGLEGGLDEFKNAYNEGKLKPATRMIDGNQVGGFTMMKNGKEIFLNFETGINQTTIDGKMNLRVDTIIKEDSNNFAKGDFGYGVGVDFYQTDKYKNIINDATLGKTEMTQEIKKLEDAYKMNVLMQATDKSRGWLLNNPGVMADTLVQMKDGLTLTESDRFHLDKVFVGDYGSNREYNIDTIDNGYEYNGVAREDKNGVTRYYDVFNQELPPVPTKMNPMKTRMMGANELLLLKNPNGDKNYTIDDARKEIKNMHDNFRFEKATLHVANEYMKNVSGAAIGPDGMVGFQEPKVDTTITTSPYEPPSGVKGGGGTGGVGVDVSALGVGASKMYTLKGLVDAAWDGGFENMDDNFSKLIDTKLTNGAMITSVQRNGNELTLWSTGKGEKAKEKQYKTIDLGNKGDRLELYTSLGITPYLENFNESAKDYMSKEFTFTHDENETAFNTLQNIEVTPATNNQDNPEKFGIQSLKKQLESKGIMKILKANGYDLVDNSEDSSLFTGDRKTLNRFSITKDGKPLELVYNKKASTDKKPKFSSIIDISDKQNTGQNDWKGYITDILKSIDFETRGGEDTKVDKSFSSTPTG